MKKLKPKNYNNAAAFPAHSLTHQTEFIRTLQLSTAAPVTLSAASSDSSACVWEYFFFCVCVPFFSSTFTVRCRRSTSHEITPEEDEEIMMLFSFICALATSHQASPSTVRGLFDGVCWMYFSTFFYPHHLKPDLFLVGFHFTHSTRLAVVFVFPNPPSFLSRRQQACSWAGLHWTVS